MRRNVELNGLGEPADLTKPQPSSESSAYVKVNEGDAWYVKYPDSPPHRWLEWFILAPSCITIGQNETVWMWLIWILTGLQPHSLMRLFNASKTEVHNFSKSTENYLTCLKGLLCVTCTDLAVLATTNYPEKRFASLCTFLKSSNRPTATLTMVVCQSRQSIATKEWVNSESFFDLVFTDKSTGLASCSPHVVDNCS